MFGSSDVGAGGRELQVPEPALAPRRCCGGPSRSVEPEFWRSTEPHDALGHHHRRRRRLIASSMAAHDFFSLSKGSSPPALAHWRFARRNDANAAAARFLVFLSTLPQLPALRGRRSARSTSPRSRRTARLRLYGCRARGRARGCACGRCAASCTATFCESASTRSASSSSAASRYARPGRPSQLTLCAVCSRARVRAAGDVRRLRGWRLIRRCSGTRCSSGGGSGSSGGVVGGSGVVGGARACACLVGAPMPRWLMSW